MTQQVVTTLGEVDYIVKSHVGQDFAFDIETSGLSPFKDRILGLSLCFADDTNVYIVCEHTVEVQPRFEDGSVNTHQYMEVYEMIRAVQPLFSQEGSWMVAHNASFDLKFLWRAGLEVKGRLYDTLLAAKMLDDNSKSLGLKELSFRELGIQMDHYQNLTHFEGFGKDEFLAVPLREAAIYALHDTEMTWQLFKKQLPKLIEEGVDRPFFEIWMEMLPILTEMSLKGIALDMDGLLKLEAEVNVQIEEIERRVFSEGIGMVLSQEEIPPNYLVMAKNIDPEFVDEGQDEIIYKGFELPLIREKRKLARVPFFNAGSNKQLGELLYDYLGLRVPPGIFLKANASGRSVDSDTLQVLLQSYGDDAPAVLQDIVEWRKFAKLKSGFLTPLQEFADPEDNYCIRTNFNQHITDTGRLSSSQPNLNL